MNSLKLCYNTLLPLGNSRHMTSTLYFLKNLKNHIRADYSSYMQEKMDELHALKWLWLVLDTSDSKWRVIMMFNDITLTKVWKTH